MCLDLPVALVAKDRGLNPKPRHSPSRTSCAKLLGEPLDPPDASRASAVVANKPNQLYPLPSIPDSHKEGDSLCLGFPCGPSP